MSLTLWRQRRPLQLRRVYPTRWASEDICADAAAGSLQQDSYTDHGDCTDAHDDIKSQCHQQQCLGDEVQAYVADCS